MATHAVLRAANYYQYCDIALSGVVCDLQHRTLTAELQDCPLNMASLQAGHT